MKRYFLKLLLVLLPTLGFAQFDYSFDIVTGVDVIKTETFIGTNYKTFIGPRVGGNFNVLIFDNVLMKTGIRYAQVGTINRRDSFSEQSEAASNGIESDPSLPEFLETTYNRRYIEIPLVLKIEFGKKKVSGYVEMGIAPHYYLNTKLTWKSNINSKSMILDETHSAGKKVRNAFVFGVGLNYMISDRYQLFFQPTFRKYTSRYTDEHLDFIARSPITFVDEELTNVGIEFGLRYGFQF